MGPGIATCDVPCIDTKSKSQDIHDGALDTGLGPQGVDVAAEQAVMAPSCLSGMSAVTASYRGDCVAKLLAALRTRNYRIQMNGVFESTLRACARP